MIIIVLVILVVIYLAPVILSALFSVRKSIMGGAYPYKRLLMTDNEIKERFARLKDYELEFANIDYRVYNLKNVPYLKLLFRGVPKLVVVKDEHYNEYNNISDYFIEDVRINCKRYDQQITPREYYKQQAANEEFNKLDTHGKREYLYSNFMECTTFKPSIVVGMAKYLCNGPPRILDISSGWGDRLIGALSIAESYQGSDPNSELFPGYEKMLAFFNADREKFRILNQKFQDVELPPWKPNLVLTSPPYYNLEEYSGNTVSSTVDEWIDEFLRPSLQKASSALEVGGHMAININDSKDVNFVYKMLEFNLANMVYLGCISQGQLINGIPKSPQPFWIWKKVELPTDLNPPSIITTHTHEGKEFRVIRDDMLLGGSKQRIMGDIFSRYNSVIYPGPTNGYAQIALALGAKIFNGKATILLPKSRPLTNQTLLALQLGAEIIEYSGEDAKLSNLRIKATEIAQAQDAYVPELGFKGDEFKTLFRGAISKCLDLDRQPIYDIWVVGGSGTLALTLLDEFPNATINVVQVGKSIDWFFKDNPRVNFYVAKEKHHQPTDIMPPYPSLDTYDAKVWQYAKDKLTENTIIWNVAGMTTLF